MGQHRSCAGCRGGEGLGFDFTMAFQPIVDVVDGRVWGYEALVRGTDGQGAGAVLGRVTDENRYRFDQACRVKAIELAGALFPDDGSLLSINFMPNAVYEPLACIRASLDAAERAGFDKRRLMFEFTENEEMRDVPHVQSIIEAYRRIGFTTAIDDFGAGFAGLNILAKFQPDLIKIDMDLVRDVDRVPAKRAILAGIVGIARELGVTVLAEGIETRAEADVVTDAGIRLLQGYYYAKPAVEALPPVGGLAREPARLSA